MWNHDLVEVRHTHVRNNNELCTSMKHVSDIIRSCACMVWICAYTARRAYKANSAYLTQYDLRDELYLYDELCLLDESVYSNQR